jgi:hypothetical protein
VKKKKKKNARNEILNRASDLNGFFLNDLGNGRGLYRAGSLKTVASEMAKCNLDLVAVQEVISQQKM